MPSVPKTPALVEFFMCPMCAGCTRSLPAPSPALLRMVTGMMTFGRALALASHPALEAPTDFTFVLGQHFAGLDHLDYLDDPDLYDSLCDLDNPAFFRPATEGHLVITGEMSTGKSVLVRDLALQTVETMDVYLHDSWHSLKHASTDAPAEVSGLAGFSCTLRGAAEMLRVVRDEVRRRSRLDAGDREGLPRILVLLDDSHHLTLHEDNSHLFGSGRSDKEAMAQASALCLAMLAEIATAQNVSVTLVFASVKDPANAAVPAELLESGFTLLNLERPFWPATGECDPASVPRYAELTRPGSDARRLEINYRARAAQHAQPAAKW